MKRLNREVLAQITVLFIIAVLLFRSVSGGEIKYYVNKHMVKYIWFSAIGVIIIALSLMPALFKPKRRNNILPCVILAIPVLLALVTPSASADKSYIKANTGQILHERDSNSSVTQFETDADIYNISDDEYLKWYSDASENPYKYDSKKVRIKGMVFRMEGFHSNEFIPARMSMMCCAADLVPFGFICRCEDAEKLENGEWVYVTAKIKVEYEPHMKKEMPVLYAISLNPAQKPENELVYPY